MAKKIKVLPVYPRFPSSFWNFQKIFEYTGKKASMPPTGLATVLAMLPPPFMPQRIIDLNVEPLTDWQIKGSDIVFVSSMVPQEDSQNEIIDRAHFYGKPVVAGGPFPTSYQQRNKNVDYIVAGEAEITLQPFLEDLLAGHPQRVYTENDCIKRNPLVQLAKNKKPQLCHTPLARWDLVNLGAYLSIGIQYSRGCPHNCEFCDITKLFGKIPRTKSPEQMLAEFQIIYDLGHKGDVFVVDDNFIGNKKNLREFLPRLIEWQKRHRYPFGLGTEASVDLAWDSNRDLLENMVEAGFCHVFLGIESPDDDVIKQVGKRQNLRMSPLECVRRIQNAGLEVTAGFIIGNDGDKPTVCEDTYRFIQEAGIPVSMVGLLSVLHGTDLYHRLKSEGRLRAETKTTNTHDFSFGFEPRLDEQFLLGGYKGLLQKLFDPKNYYERCRVLQRELGSFRSINLGMWEGLKAFGRFVLDHFTNPDVHNHQTTRYLLQTALTNPRYFSRAVADAMKIKHLQQITREALEADRQKADKASFDAPPQIDRGYVDLPSDIEHAYGRIASTI
jgi:radical SAM superfamily enzyme YgiQ (UPF0313 family)